MKHYIVTIVIIVQISSLSLAYEAPPDFPSACQRYRPGVPGPALQDTSRCTGCKCTGTYAWSCSACGRNGPPRRDPTWPPDFPEACRDNPEASLQDSPRCTGCKCEGRNRWSCSTCGQDGPPTRNPRWPADFPETCRDNPEASLQDSPTCTGCKCEGRNRWSCSACGQDGPPTRNPRWPADFPEACSSNPTAHLQDSPTCTDCACDGSNRYICKTCGVTTVEPRISTVTLPDPVTWVEPDEPVRTTQRPTISPGYEQPADFPEKCQQKGRGAILMKTESCNICFCTSAYQFKCDLCNPTPIKPY